MKRSADSIASSFDFSSKTAYPPMTSLASVKGPSIVVTCPRESRTRVLIAVGASSPLATIVPTLFASSLSLSMASINAWSGRPDLSADLTINMNFIVISPLWFRVRNWAVRTVSTRGIQPPFKRRTGDSEIDTCNIFLSFARFAGARPWRAAPTSSRPLALLELLTQRGLVASGLLDLGREIFEFLNLANLEHFVVLHHRSNGLGVRHGARRGLLVPLRDHQHHESHRFVSL